MPAGCRDAAGRAADGERSGEPEAGRGVAGAGGLLPASRKAAPSSTVPESSWRGMVLPEAARGSFRGDGREAEAPTELRRALLGAGLLPPWRR